MPLTDDALGKTTRQDVREACRNGRRGTGKGQMERKRVKVVICRVEHKVFRSVPKSVLPLKILRAGPLCSGLRVSRLHRSYTPPVNRGCSDVAAPLAVRAKRVTDKESRDEPRFARLLEYFQAENALTVLRLY